MDREGSASDTITTTEFLDRGEGRVAYDVTGQGHTVLCLPGMGERPAPTGTPAPPW